MNTGFNQAFGFSQSCGFGNGFSYVEPVYVSGIKKDRYNSGYFADDPAWFDGRTISATTYPTAISDTSPSGDDNFSVRWTGYFRPATTDTYTFYLNSDDASYMWIGENTKRGATVSNCLVNNGGPHGSKEVSASVTLTAGVSYPILVIFGDIGGPNLLTFSYSTPTISKTTNVSSLVYYNSAAKDSRGF